VVEDKRSGRGRVRDPAVEVAVLEAAITILALEGVAGTSMDRVAAEAGVSKVTVYTRYPSKSALIGAALTHLQVDHVPEPTGAARTDLAALLGAMRRQYDEVGGMSIIGSCLAAEPRSRELLDLIRASTLLPRRRQFARVLRAGVDRGELRADLDVERATSMLVGVLYADHLAGVPADPGWATSVVDDVLRGIGA
jgi:AcrR family transcriptional regulator